MVKELREKELTSDIIKAAFEVHNNLGCGFLESVYENALCMELVFRGKKVEREKKVVIRYKGNVVGKYAADIIVENKVIVELKNAKAILPEHKAQLLNFSKPKLEIKRFVM